MNRAICSVILTTFIFSVDMGVRFPIIYACGQQFFHWEIEYHIEVVNLRYHIKSCTIQCHKETLHLSFSSKMNIYIALSMQSSRYAISSK